MIATSIEQSKKLLELGLDPTSADMHYEWTAEEPEFKLYIGGNIAINYNLFSYRNGHIIPAWSLDRLLELMPPYLFEWEEGIDLQLYPAVTEKRWQCGYLSEDLSPENLNRFTEIKFGGTPS